jgi:hypothetical protein
MRRTARSATVDFADEGDYVDASEYERLTGIAKESYEQRLLTEAQALLEGEWTVEPDDAPTYTRLGVSEHGSVDDVSLEGDGTDAALAVLFRSDARPGRVFGWRVPVWPHHLPTIPRRARRRAARSSCRSTSWSSWTSPTALRPQIPMPGASPGSSTEARG